MATFTVDTLSDDPSAGVTLREALALADGAAGADRIEFTAAIQGGTITLTGGQLTVASDVTIDGGTGITIDANQQSRVLAITGGSDADPNEVTLDSLTITGGQTAEYFGGGINAAGGTSLTLTGTTVSGNSMVGNAGYGGGIFAGGSLALTDSTVSGNSISNDNFAVGGGIYARGNLTLTDSTVSGNSVLAGTGYVGFAAIGGGICGNLSFGSSTVTITDSTISDNSAESGGIAFGGGIYASSLTLTGSMVDGNSVTGTGSNGVGGGLAGNNVTLTSSTVSNNDASFGGGGIYGVTASSVTITDSTVSGNNTDGSGGGIHARAGLTITDSMIRDNSAARNGGGTYQPFNSLIATSSTISGNSSGGRGGGIYSVGGNLTDSTISGNNTGIFTFRDTFDLTHSTVTGNSGYGISAFYGTPRTITLANSIVAGNGAGADVIGASLGSSNGHNLFGSAVAGAVAGDVQNVDPASIFAALDPVTGGGLLADHGGPTQTIALRAAADNPALAAALAIAGLDTDQRGEARPAPDGSAPDIGAFELGTARLSLGAGVAQAEGDAGTTNLAFTVTRGGELASAVSAAWAVTGGTVDGADFVGGTLPTGIVEFARGQTEATITIRVQGDTVVEVDESFTLTLSAPSFAAELGTATATGTIRNDDTTPLPEILGTGRADLLKGSAAAEILRGGGGGDLILALGGDDRLFGDGGDDILVGGTGLDQMTGGRGEDRFAFRAAAEAPPAGPGYDEILDFTRQDEIDLRNLDANEGRRGNQAFDFLGTGALTGTAQLRYEATGDGDFLVTGSTDADAAAEFAFIVRTDLTSLRAGDFML